MDSTLDLNSEVDPIVHDIPVYLSSGLASKLHLFQFPIRRPSFSENVEPRPIARFKPNAHIMSIDLPLDPQSNIYNQSEGERYMADPVYISDQKINNEPMVSQKRLESLCYTSCTVPPKAVYYAVVFKDGLIHFSKVQSVMQFSPDLSHIDMLDQRQKDAKKNAEEQENLKKGDEKKTQVHLPRVETEEMLQAKKKNVVYVKHQIDEEKPVSMRLFPKNSSNSMAVFELLYSKNESPVSTKGTAEMFLEMNMPEFQLNADSLTIQPGSICQADMKKLPLILRVQALMTNCRLLPFSKIIECIKVQQDELFENLRQIAVSIGDVWIINSNLLYSGRTMFARDFLISMFHDSVAIIPQVSRKKFAQVAGLDVETTFSLLSELGVLVNSQESPVWQLKYSVNRNEIISNYNDFKTGPLVDAIQELFNIQEPMDIV